MRWWGTCIIGLLAACPAATPDAPVEDEAPRPRAASATDEPVSPLSPSPFKNDDPVVHLGKALFFSDKLGNATEKNPGATSCAQCHPLGQRGPGTSGANYQVKMGSGSAAPTRLINCPTIFN